MRLTRFLFAVLSVLTLAHCGMESRNEVEMPMQTASPDWPALARQRVFFGHQSVGGNILDGIRALAKRDNAALPIAEDRSRTSPTGITHFMVGVNGDARSKIDDFRKVVDSGAAHGADVAMMKLCYVDITAGTDAVAVARHYIGVLDDLATRHPSTRFVAVTAPLTRLQTGPRAWVKRMLGRLPAGYHDNARRADFNQLLRQHYAGTGRLFDLAQLEATGLGVHHTVVVDGTRVDVMDPSLTPDDGHLNEAGQRIVGAAFLQFLGTLRKAD